MTVRRGNEPVDSIENISNIAEISNHSFPEASPVRNRVWIPVALLPVVVGCATVLAKKVTPVMMTSTPAGAEVWIDGARAGTTPVTVELSNNSEHIVVFTIDGRDEVTCRINRKVGVGWVVLDILMFAWPVVIDAITGAWNQLDSKVCDVTLPEAAGVGF